MSLDGVFRHADAVSISFLSRRESMAKKLNHDKNIFGWTIGLQKDMNYD